LAYYLAEVFHLVGFGIVASIKIIFVLSIFVSFLGMYLLAREFWGKMAGLAAGILYIFTCYRALNLYVRGAFTETLALGLAPLVAFLLIRAVMRKSFYGGVLAGLFYGLLVLSHNITAMVFTGFWLLTAVFYIVLRRLKNKSSDIFYLISPVAVGLAISCFFWVPALVEKNLVRTETMTAGILDFHLHFPRISQLVYSPWTYGGSGANFGISISDMSFQLGAVNWLVVAVSFLFLVWNWFKKRRIDWIGLGAFFLFMISLFLITSKSKLLWENVYILSYVQFPWRFLGWTTFFSAILAGFIFSKLKSEKGWVLVIGFLVLAVGLNINYFKPKEHFEIDEESLISDERIAQGTTGVTDEYLPKWTKVKPERSAKRLIEIESGKIEIANLKTNYYLTTFDYQLDRKGRVFVKYIYYPGFEALLNDEKLEIDSNNKRGLISFLLPKGEGKVEVIFGETNLRKTVNAISLLSFGLVLILLLRWAFIGLTRTR